MVGWLQQLTYQHQQHHHSLCAYSIPQLCVCTIREIPQMCVFFAKYHRRCRCIILEIQQDRTSLCVLSAKYHRSECIIRVMPQVCKNNSASKRCGFENLIWKLGILVPVRSSRTPTHFWNALFTNTACPERYLKRIYIFHNCANFFTIEHVRSSTSIYSRGT